MKEKNYQIHIGALADKLSVQLKKNNLKFNKGEIKHFEKVINAYTQLRIPGYLTDSQADMVSKKIFKRIEKHIQEKNG